MYHVAEAGGSQVPDLLGLHGKDLSLKKEVKKKRKRKGTNNAKVTSLQSLIC